MSGPRPPIVERAFQIANSGGASSTKAIRQVLVFEGYPHNEIAGSFTGLAIRRSLAARIATAPGQNDKSPPPREG